MERNTGVPNRLIPVRYLLLAATALSLSCSNAAAQWPLLSRACAPDIKAHCGQVASGKGRLQSCVKQHFQDFSDACAARLAHAATAHHGCKPDVGENCRGVKPTRSVEECMKHALAKLGEACKGILARAVVGRR